MKLQGWKKAATGVFLASLVGGAPSAGLGFDVFGDWEAFGGSSLVLATDDGPSGEGNDVGAVGANVELGDAGAVGANVELGDAGAAGANVELGDAGAVGANVELGDAGGASGLSDLTDWGESRKNVGFAGGVSGDDFAALLGRTDALADETAALSGKTDALADETAALSGKTDALADETAALSGKTDALTGETAALSGKTDALTDETAALSGKTDALTDETASLRAELAALRQETAALKVDFENAKAKQAADAAKKADPNGPFNLKFSGRAVADATLVSAADDFNDFYGETSNMWKLRDVCLMLRGAGYGNLEYAFCFAVADSVKIYDFYLRCNDTRYFGDVRVGQFHVESGIESMTVLYDTPYATVDANASVFRFSRRLGIGSTRHSQDERLRLFTGAFIPKSFNAEPYGTLDDNPGLVLNARLSGLPIYEEDEKGGIDELLHLGGSFYWVAPGAEDATQRFRTRGLGWSSSSPYFLDGTISLADRSYSVSEIEAVWQRKGFATLADGFVQSVEDGANAFGTTVGARWLLTPGCSWGYSKDMGRFSSPKIPEEARFVNAKDRVVAGNWGAWEVLGKWGWTEANDLRESPGATFGTVNRLTTGVNWYWNEKAMWTLNWERAFVNAQRRNAPVDSTVDSLILQAAVKF